MKMIMIRVLEDVHKSYSLDKLHSSLSDGCKRKSCDLPHAVLSSGFPSRMRPGRFGKQAGERDGSRRVERKRVKTEKK